MFLSYIYYSVQMKESESLKIVLLDYESASQVYIPIGEKVRFSVEHNGKQVGNYTQYIMYPVY